jgi:membrane protein YdbS with pleckstrin-like domain
MLSSKEKEFIEYWEKNRLSQKTTAYRLRRGLPFSLLFITPVLVTIVLIYFASPDWYAKIAGQISVSLPVIVVAIFLFAFLFSLMRMQFQWEAYEQQYLEIKAKQAQHELP